MMTLSPGTTGDSSASSSLSAAASRGVLMSKPLVARRRRSKGTIAGFASGKEQSLRADDVSGQDPGDNVVSSQSTAQNPQHSTGEHSVHSSRPCHTARLALMCCQNASRMGARTQLGLCPPGRARRSLQTAARSRSQSNRRISSTRSSSGSFKLGESEVGGYYGIDKLLGQQQLTEYDDKEEDHLLRHETYDVDSDEEMSSGDEDELNNLDALLSVDDSCTELDDEKKYQRMREPLFVSSGGDPSVSNPNGAPMTATSSGKLPFNHRKIKYFDDMTATDRMEARNYLRNEYLSRKRRDGQILGRHLKKMQRREKRRLLIEKGEDPSVVENSDQESEDGQEQALLNGAVSQFPLPMTPPLSAALVLESLMLNTVESLEGMGKCYDGIVAAGLALLDSQVGPAAPSEDESKSRPSRSEIVNALTPLLITSLDQVSGEVILALARLRRMCATPRYQRRFVQRVAPCLIRPPRGALWCLRHQNDMEPILAATELIFDSAFEIFGKGWYDRGQLLLADSKRAETLSAAAEQLKNLSAAEPDGLALVLGHGHRRNHKLMVGTAPNKDSATGASSNEPLAEWEVIAVDRQIRISISNIVSKDWSRVVVQVREPDIIGRGGSRRTGVAATASRPRPATIQTSGPDASPLSLQPPRSPPRPGSKVSAGISPKATRPLSPKAAGVSPKNIGRPLSPRALQVPNFASSSAAESMESVFGPSFSSQPPSAVVASPSVSPGGSDGQPPSLTPISPPASRRPALDTDDAVESRSPFTSPPNTPKLIPNTSLAVDAQTPPRSPLAGSKKSMSPMHSSPSRRPPAPVDSPGTTGLLSSPATQMATDRLDRAPLSPSAASIGSATSEVAAYRGASSSSVASAISSTSQTPNYRMLTSTAAERKRTVAACRALRAQISRFEEAFIQLHGRPPKGASERAPLASTYAQYREWKRAIRADAACRIQALFRGARTRWLLLRRNDPRMARVVMRRAGRSRLLRPGESPSRIPGNETLKHLSIPTEIGHEPDDSAMRLNPVPGTASPEANSQSFNNEGVEVFISPSHGDGGRSQSTGLAPHWSSSLPRRRPSGEPFPGPRAGSPPQFPSPTGFSAGAASSGLSSELSGLSLPELQARKRDLKQQLKQYDMKFARKHGRMPVKAEKEPIRHLYENYNALKTQINVLEQEAHQPRTPGLRSSPGSMQHTPSPPGNVSTVTDSSGDESPSGQKISRQGLKKKTSALSPPPIEPPAQAASTPTGAPSQDLAALKAEKSKLHQMLRSYEKDFLREHRRQVSSFADIKPVAGQYRRYKEIKKAIASLQQSER